MQYYDYLNLRLVKLARKEEWPSSGDAGLGFVFPVRGAGTWSGGRAKEELQAGDVLVLSGETDGKLTAWGEEDLLFHWFSVRVEQLYPLFLAEEIPLLRAVAQGIKGARRYPATGGVAQECQRLLADLPPQLSLDHRGHLLKVVTTILSTEFDQARAGRNASSVIDDHVLQVFEKLSAEELQGLSIDDLARRFACSRRHLNRLFHRYFGISVAALKMELRLVKAISLLQDPSAKIYNVAEECGFHHWGLFNTCFKKRFGVSPSQWRKNTAKRGMSSLGQTADAPVEVPPKVGLYPPYAPPMAEEPVTKARGDKGRGSRDRAAKAPTTPVLSPSAWKIKLQTSAHAAAAAQACI